MVMTQHKKDRLVDLLESLTGPEKTYIKKRAKAFRNDSSAQYLRLFDLMEKQNSYNEKKLIAAFGSTEQLTRTKNYLYNFILNALEGYQAAGNPVIKQKEVLSTVNILFDRGLYTQSKQVLLTGLEKPGFKYNYFLYLEALNWRKKIALAELDTESLNETTKEEIRVNKMVENLNQFETLYYRTFSVAVLAGDARTQANRDEINDIFSFDLLQSKNNALTIQAISYFHQIRSICLNFKGRSEDALTAALDRIEALEQHQDYLLIDPQNYINALTNCIEATILLKKYDTSATLIDRLKNFEVNNYHLSARKDTRAILNNLQLCILSGSYLHTEKLSIDVKNLIQRYSRLIRTDEKTELQFLLVVLYMNQSNYKTALYWINVIINESEAGVRMDLQVNAKLMNVFIHLKLGHFELVDYLLRNTHNYLKKKKLLSETEKLILDFVKEEVQHTSNSLLENKMRILKENLDQFTSTEKGINAFRFLRL